MSNLKNRLPPHNPLRDISYWGSENNLDVIAALEWSKAFLEQMNFELPCAENVDSIWHINRAIQSQIERTIRRQTQGVLGTNQPHECNVLNKLDDVA